MPHNIILINYADALSGHLLDEIARSLEIGHIELIDVAAPARRDYPFSITHHDANALHYGAYDVDWCDITPLEPWLIEAMAPHEIVALRMLDRGRKPQKIANKLMADMDAGIPSELFTNDDLSYDQRRRIYMRHLRYWHHVVKTRQIDYFVCVNVPHIVYDYVAYAVCRTLNVPTLFFDRPLFPGAVYPRTCFEQQLQVPTTLNGPAQVGTFTQEWLDIQKHRHERLKKSTDGWQFYLSREKMRRVFYAGDADGRLKSLTRSLYHQTFRNQKDAVRKNIRANRNKKLFYKKLDILESYIEKIGHSHDVLENRKFIYMALHYQPESSTCPQAGQFVEQLLMIDLLSAAVPDDVLIAVKEHPAQTAACRDPEYYADIAARRNVRLMRNDVDTYALIKGSMAVATANGTVAWEALYRQRPAILFGNGIAGQAPAGFPVNTLEECKDALRRIAAGEYDASEAALVSFFARLEQGGLRIYHDDKTPEKLRVQGVSEEMSVKVLIQEVAARLAK